MCEKVRLLFAASLFLLLAFGAYGQSDQGQIAGTVKDSSGAVVPGAEVTGVDPLSGMRVTATTGPNGAYVLTSLPVARYDVTIRANGFKQLVQRGVNVDAAARTTLDATLEVGQVSDSVTVEAKAELVDRETAQIGRTVDSEQISNLALNGRNPIKLADLKAGVIGAENFNDFAPSQLHEQFSINGGRRAGNNVVIDGVAASRTRGDLNGTAELGLLNADAVEQVQILTSTYPAEFGHGQDGQIIFISKSGGRSFHGSAYNYLRNAAFDANTWTRNQSPNASDNSRPAPFRFNEPGYSLGGPIYIPKKFNSDRNKLFFFVAQEWVMFRQDRTSTGIVPSALMRTGDFSELLSASNTFFKKVRTVTDPQNGVPFAGNIIPKNRLSPNGIGLLSAYPLPTAGFLQGSNNWISTLPHPIDSRRDSIRVDYNLNDKNRINFSGTHFGYKEYDPFANVGALDRSDSGWDRPNGTASVGLTSTLAPNKVNQLNIGAGYDKVLIFLYDNGVGNGSPWIRTQYGMNYPYILGTVNNLLRIPERIPQAAITGLTTIDGSARPEGSSGPMYSISDSFTWVKGSGHTLKFGFLLERGLQNNNDQTNVQNGIFSFVDTGHPLTTGLAMGNVAMGNFNTDTERGQAAYTLMRSWAFEGFAQDTWKLSPKLTLEYGVRYSYYQPWYAVWNDIASFEPKYYDPSKVAVVDPGPGATIGAILSGSQYNGIVLPGDGYPASAAGRAYGASVPGTSALFHNLPRGLVNSYKNAFAPRLGVAYNVADKTVIRAGGGVFHQRQMANQNSLFTNPPNQMVVTVNNGSIDNPGGASLRYPLDFRAADLNFKYPTAYSYSLSVQRELPGSMVLDLAYVGKTGVNQERVNGLNAAAPGTVQAHPGQSISAFRPYLGLGNINYTTRDGRTSYNSFQATVDKRLGKGLAMGMAYTFSKNLSNLMNQLGTQMAYNPQGFVKGIDELDRTHVVNVNFMYDLPILQNSKGLAHNLLGGWHLSGVFFARSGAPLSVTTTVDNAGVGPGLGPQPWNVVGDTTVSGARGVGLPWFNPAAFAKPNAGTFGNAGLGIIKGPGYWNLDMAMFKDFHVSERVTAQFRWEVYDVPNYAFLANPGLDPTATATFGIITSKGGTGVAGSSSAASASQRDMQIALKIRF